MTIAVAALLWVAVTAYAVTGGADFGGGLWDLLAGGADRGARPRELIDQAISPVWEANHVWLIIDLVLLWTAFPIAFAAITSTLFVPLSIVALGIVLRGAGFAFRKSSRSLRSRQLTGAVFALSSLLTPFFMGTAVGAIVTGRVPANGAGNRLTSWTTPTSLTLGALALLAFAYLAAVYLVVGARRQNSPELVRYFSRRAIGAGLMTGALAIASLAELETSAHRIFTNLLDGRGLPLVVVSALLGLTVLLLLAKGVTRGLRPLAAGAFIAVLWGWGVAQYPELLPGMLSLAAGAAPTSSLITEVVVTGIVAVLVAPSFVLLYHLAERGLLTESGESTEDVLKGLPAHGGGPNGRTAASAEGRGRPADR